MRMFAKNFIIMTFCNKALYRLLNAVKRKKYLVVCGDNPVKSDSVGSIPTLSAEDTEETRDMRKYGANLR